MPEPEAKHFLVIGGGGREHAIGWGLHREGNKVSFIPGNAGTLNLGKNIKVDLYSKETLKEILVNTNPDVVVIGPEKPIADGIGDFIRENVGIPVFAPSSRAAQLEASKIFAKEFMKKHGVPTAKFRVCESLSEALMAIEDWDSFPVVIKADGLAAGKGVTIAHDKKTAASTLVDYIEKGKFGDASRRVVLEEFLAGFEASVFVLVDNEFRYLLIGDAMDYKRLLDGDRGPNTGGMGSISPHPLLDNSIRHEIEERIIMPTINGLKREDLTYIGVLYFGLMITATGPYVLEYNIRFGDPEAQVLIPRITTGLSDLLYAVATDSLKGISPPRLKGYAVAVILASGGYPISYKKGFEISGLDKVNGLDGVIVFHAGTRMENERILTSGGRVLNIVGLGESLREAVERAYNAIEYIEFQDMYYRRDIASVFL